MIKHSRVYYSSLFVCTLVLGLWQTFLASSQSLPLFFSKILNYLHYHYSEFFFFWKIGLSPRHLVIFLGFYLVSSFGTKSSVFSSWLTSCNVVLVLAAEVLWFFLFLLSTL